MPHLRLLVLASGAHRVNTKLVATTLRDRNHHPGKADLRRRIARTTDRRVSPIGHPQPLRTILDADLVRHDLLWAGGGDPTPCSARPTPNCWNSLPPQQHPSISADLDRLTPTWGVRPAMRVTRSARGPDRITTCHGISQQLPDGRPGSTTTCPRSR
ncbi:hypothetical protein I1A62_10335 [Rhodococcus sp. USK10]|uniref:YbaK/EbsC family protein n=1 Tax=Rhodococcus sp. USK10 TaxID=2789739 RepID=UPI001C5F4454|nr:hypothetical protein I1A62_10335 [Rhodococcus sp. USK10]